LALRIRFQGGPRAGETLEIGDDVESIVFGRDPEKCKVLFPAQETSVGREHCAIKRVLGRYRLVLNGDNSVLVDGRPAHPDQGIDASVDLQLGAHGPKMIVETLGNATLPRTVDQGEHQPGQGTLLEQLGSGARRTRTLVIATILLLVGVAGFSWWMSRTARLEVGAQLQAAAKDLQAKVNAEAPTLRDVVGNIRKSVYLVLLRNPTGEDSGVGTAWVAGDGVLATNAHVARVFTELTAGQRLLARSCSSPPVDHEITEVNIHPGYDEFEKVWKEFAPIQVFGQSAQVLSNIRACDVALMTVTRPKDLAPPIATEPLDGLKQLQAGDIVGYVGYPMENMALGGANLKMPSPQSQIAHLTNVTNFFLVQSLTGEGQLVQHALPAHGGASGSPIFNSKGNVIALLSAGNVMATLEGRAPLGVNVNFGQRADLLQELLDGTADKSQPPRSELWRKDIRQFTTLKDEWPKLTARWAEEWKVARRFSGESKLSEKTGTFQNLEPEGFCLGAVDVTLPKAGRYLLLAVNLSGERMGLALPDSSGTPEVKVDLANFHALYEMTADRKMTFQAALISPAKGSNFVFQVYRAIE
jgi:hypothetical protein